MTAELAPAVPPHPLAAIARTNACPLRSTIVWKGWRLKPKFWPHAPFVFDGKPMVLLLELDTRGADQRIVAAAHVCTFCSAIYFPPPEEMT